MCLYLRLALDPFVAKVSIKRLGFIVVRVEFESGGRVYLSLNVDYGYKYDGFLGKLQFLLSRFPRGLVDRLASALFR